MAKKIITMPSTSYVNKVECFERSGYDNHYYTVLHDANTGEYLGELQDVGLGSSELVKRIMKEIGCEI